MTVIQIHDAVKMAWIVKNMQIFITSRWCCRWLRLLCGLFFTGEDHGTVADTDQPSFKWGWQRTAGVVVFVSMSSSVDAENVDKNDGEADDERQQRPEHTMHDSRLGHDVQYHVARITRVSKADVRCARVAVLLCKTLHRSHVVLSDSVTLVKWALDITTIMIQYLHLLQVWYVQQACTNYI